MINEEPVQNVIGSFLGQSRSSVLNKYNDYEKEIVSYSWQSNEFDGYVLREFIEKKTMYNIVLNSNSAIAKTFKNNVSQILVDLRKSNQLILINDELVLVEQKQTIPRILKINMNDEETL